MKKFLSGSIFYLLAGLIPLILYIKFTQYGFYNLEVVYLFSTVIGLSLAAYCLECVTGWYGRILVSTIFLTFCLSFLPDFKNPYVLAAVFFLILLLNIFQFKNFRTIVLVMASVFLVSLIIFPVKPQFTQVKIKQFNHKLKEQKHLPPVIHIMLDGFAGIEGIPKNIVHGNALRHQLQQFFTHNNFTLYTKAYSHYLRTYNSVSNLVNFSSKPQSHYYFNKDSDNLKQNRYFEMLGKMGYQIHVFEFSQMINYCEPNRYPVTYCYTYPAASLKIIKSLNIAPFDKYLFVLKSYLLWSEGYQMLKAAYEQYLLPVTRYFGISMPRVKWYQARTSAIWIPTVFNHLTKAVIAHPDGSFFYAHILGPHSPYVYNAHCKLIKNPMKWQINLYDNLPLNTDISRIKRYQLYENQLMCVTQQLQHFFTRLKKVGIYQKAIIIINGDHGSRITKVLPTINMKNKMNEQAFKDCFQTLFAVKMPHAKPQLIYKMIPIQNILAKTVTNITGKKIKFLNTAPYAYLVTLGFHGEMPKYFLKKSSSIHLK